MTLYFEKLQGQINSLGITLADRSQTAARELEQAERLLRQLADVDDIWEQIKLARQNDAGFRGAAPMNEPINVPYLLPPCPDRATIFAADGSQVFPDPHGPAAYYLTNIGVFIYHHGTDALPEFVVEPQLYFRDEDVLNFDGQMIPNSAVNARRTVFEMQTLARTLTERADAAPPLLALYDGPLLGTPIGKDVPDAATLQADYHEGMDFIWDADGLLAGYVDRPTSRFVLYTLFLMTLAPDEITAGNLGTLRLDGMSDVDVFKSLLPPGGRSALMVQQSPLNKDYADRWSPMHEIVFFYLNTASAGQSPYLARVEIPMWVARNAEAVNAIHALLYSQCQITDRYPYALTRADEIAVVSASEKRALDEMIAVALLKNQQPVESSQKLSSKWMARHGRRKHDGV
ncbi:MAG: DNA double-strand break repair nuclease NurA [Anaerolineae bacterium]